jgi:predicted alpha/beta-fold hydrolase
MLPAPVSRPWIGSLIDPDLGSIQLTGELSEPAGAEALVVVVHGLAGCSTSPYVVQAATRLVESGFACLRLNLRGADRTGEDIYHAGLTADLAATFASQEVAAFDRTALLGFSLGGHVALRSTVENPPAGLGATVAICPPLDLAAAATTIDSPSRWMYRRYLLARLREIYAEVAQRRQLASSVAEIGQARTFVEFDSLVIAPRYGFVDAWDYYRSVSVGPHLARLETPTLVVAVEGDPMVPAESLRAPLRHASDALLSFWSKPGGHLSLPRNLDLGLAAEAGLYPQILGWLRMQLAV